jgi:proteasome accessory factor C
MKLLDHLKIWLISMVKNFGDNQVERLLDLVPYLVANQGVALEKVAKDFNSSRASILEDLNTLWMCGLPGYTPLELIDLSFDTGYVSIRNADILSHPRKLSSYEIGAIVVGLSILKQSVDEHSNHFQQIEELIMRLSRTSQIVAPAMIESAVASSVRNTLSDAINRRRLVSLSYYSFAKDTENVRRVKPLGIENLDNYEYLYAFCYLANDFRNFRLDRIKDVATLDIMDDVVNQVDSEVIDEYEFLVKVNSQPRKVMEVLHIQIPPDYSFDDEFLCSAFNAEWINRTIASLAGSANISQPNLLRSQIRERAAKALALYK